MSALTRLTTDLKVLERGADEGTDGLAKLELAFHVANRPLHFRCHFRRISIDIRAFHLKTKQAGLLAMVHGIKFDKINTSF